ncbi:MAG: hypothetical protein V8R91_12420 [Butyricimonas faecihominis]
MVYDGDFTVTYGEVLGDTPRNMAVGASASENNSFSKGFSGYGFPEGNFTSPGFINSYPEGSAPSYNDSKDREVNFYFNGGYSYDNRYLLDVNLRSEWACYFWCEQTFFYNLGNWFGMECP